MYEPSDDNDDNDADEDYVIEDKASEGRPPITTSPQIIEINADEPMTNIVLPAVEFYTDHDVDAENPQPKNQLKDIPLFTSDAEKEEFEKCLNVNLSMFDDMFTVIQLQQDVNDKGISEGGRSCQAGLKLYTCNTCEKVFKSLSHVRLHAIIHTDLHPFKCPKCSYSCNSKGNCYCNIILLCNINANIYKIISYSLQQDRSISITSISLKLSETIYLLSYLFTDNLRGEQCSHKFCAFLLQ